MSESCIINGERCTSCCRSIALPNPLSHYRRYAASGGDGAFVARHWKPLKRRQAKKQNRYAFDKAERRQRQNWFRCSLVTSSGCSVHENRPHVCSGYPKYEMSDEQFILMHKGKTPEYHPDCTEFDLIRVANL